MRKSYFILIAFVLIASVFAAARLLQNDYVFFAGFVVLQFIVLATAWNILGGYCGYVNFGTAAFFAIGAYTSVALHKFDPNRPLELCFRESCAELSFSWLAPLFPLSIPVLIVIGGIISGIVGLGTGYLTLRLRGAFFSIATLALAVVLQTLVINWDYVGGSRGAYIIRPATLDVAGYQLPYIQYLFILMLILALVAVVTARVIEGSKLGYGFATIRDDELAAEACGVPTLRLKLIATTLSGAFMGMAGAPFPYYIGYIEPASAFGLAYAVNAIAMPMIGGTSTWLGPVIGAVLLGTLQQVATVTISSAVNLLLVGVLLVAFVIIAPNGLVGLVQNFARVAAPRGVHAREVAVIAVAIYAFLAGIVGIVVSIAVLSQGGPNALAIGSALLALSILSAAVAYGLLTVQTWAIPLAIAVSVASVLAAALAMSTGGLRWTYLVPAVVAVAIAAFLLQGNVRRIYQPALGGAA